MFFRPVDVIGKDKKRGVRVSLGHSGRRPGIVGRGADLQDGVFRLAVVSPAQMHRHRPGRPADFIGFCPSRFCFGPQFRPDGGGEICKIGFALEVPPGEEILGGAAAHRHIAVGGKVHAQQIEQRSPAALPPVPVPGQQPLALLGLDHQRLGGVLPGQMGFGKTRLGQDLHLRREVQRFQRTDGVGGGAVPPVLPVQQGDGLAAAQPQRPGKSINKHLIAQATGQFGVDHARPPS